MKPVTPPEATAALRELLASGQFVKPDLFTFRLPSGTVLRYSSADVPITVNGHTFVVDGPLISRGKTRSAVGLEVDELELVVHADDSHLVDGVPFVTAVLTGVFDGAEVTLERAFGPSLLEPMIATVELFTGKVAEREFDDGLVITVKDPTELLDAQVPRNTVQPSCLNTLYSANCGVDRAARVESGTITSGTVRTIQTTLASRPASYFTLGVLAFTSGANSGIRRSVKSDAAGTFSFALPLPHVPQAGDTFTVVPGCDRTMASCQGKFNNLIRFRGQPFVPAPETIAPS